MTQDSGGYVTQAQLDVLWGIIQQLIARVEQLESAAGGNK